MQQRTMKCPCLIFFLTLVIASGCNNNARDSHQLPGSDVATTDPGTDHKDTVPAPSGAVTVQRNIDSFSFDTVLYNCLYQPDGCGATTIGMMGCFEEATVVLDTLVKIAYAQLYSKLDKTDKRKLKLSQDN